MMLIYTNANIQDMHICKECFDEYICVDTYNNPIEMGECDFCGEQKDVMEL